jgi:hypothetical protein
MGDGRSVDELKKARRVPLARALERGEYCAPPTRSRSAELVAGPTGELGKISGWVTSVLG